jgi:hypothetical protein
MASYGQAIYADHPNPDPYAEPIKETLASTRTHSTIRFVALPFFLAAFGLLAKELSDSVSKVPLMLIALVGIVLSVVSCSLEVVLSRNLIAWYTALDRLKERAPHWGIVSVHRESRAAVQWVRWALFAPYPLSLWFWLYQVISIGVVCNQKLAFHPLSQTLVALIVPACVVAWAHWIWKDAGAAISSSPSS